MTSQQTATGCPIRPVLESKGTTVWSVAPEATVFDAIRMMSEKSVGALLVISDGQPVGIISERDYARKVVLQGRSSKETPVREIMSSPVIFVTPDYTVDQCFYLMTAHRIRHLPVMEGSQLAGVLSIGDLVRATVAAQKETIDQLTHYILGNYPR
jgi:CBS domain-containing protein